MNNQRSFRNWRFSALAGIKAVANANVQTLCFCDETDTLYKYDPASGVTADDKYVLTTGAGGTTRWIGIAGKYVYASGNPCGEMYLTATSAVAVAQTPTYTELGGTTVLGDAIDFDMPANNQLRYIGILTRKFKVTASLSASSSAGADTYLFRLAKSGTTILKSHLPRYMSGVLDTGAMPLSCVTDLAQNEYVGVWCARSSVPARNITMQGLNLIAEALD